MQHIIKLVMGEAAKSNIEKRQVGCVIVHTPTGDIVGKGFNVEGTHAEIAALKSAKKTRLNTWVKTDYKAYVSHPPCPACAFDLALNVSEVIVVEPFKKFDGDKTRYDLVPPSAIKGMAEVLTFGARKYEPNNWRKCEDLGRYRAAAMRHFEAYRDGEFNDSETGLSHLSHAMTNLAFLIELEETTK